MSGRQRARRAFGLFVLLVAVYFATYTGHPVSTDEMMLFDAARSFAQHGSFELAYTFDLQPFATLRDNAPVDSLNVEPMQVYGTAPLLWLAEILPGIGMLQAAWLFNIFVTTLTAVVLYYYGAALGYRDATALSVALIFGLATIAWPYSQMYFREPLLTLFLLLSAYAAERWRRAQGGALRPQLIWMAFAIAALTGAAFTKDAGVSMLPALLIIALPGSIQRLFTARMLRLLIPAALIGLTVLAVLVALRFDDTLARLSNPSFTERYLAYLPEALPAYLISPGFSLWVFSPVLLLGWVGAFRLLRARQWREFALPLVVLLIFAIGHATLHGMYWYGGLAWGTRFLVPVTPFMALWLLPVLEHPRPNAARPMLLRLAVMGVIALSIGVQLVAVALPASAYSTHLQQESQQLNTEILAWREGVWNLRYNPILVNLEVLGKFPSAVAWAVNGAGAAVLPLCLIAIVAACFLLFRALQHPAGCALHIGTALAALVIMLGLGLRSLYRDPRFGGRDDTLWRVYDTLRTQTRPGDTVILNSPAYRPFMFNYYKLQTPIYVIPTAQGETVDPDAPPFVVSDNPDERADPYFQIVFARIALRSARWWFLTEYTPFTTNRLRVTEQYLSRHYFPAAEVLNEPTARLILYAPVSAPPDIVPPWPETPVNAAFGPAILIGADFPRGRVFEPGELLPVSLLWQHDGWPQGMTPFDYSVNLSLVDAGGVVRAQRAVQPLNSFGPMSLWTPGSFYRDNHALVLPNDLPPGEYDLWALVFDWRDGSSLPVRDSAGRTLGTYVTIGKIQIEPER